MYENGEVNKLFKSTVEFRRSKMYSIFFIVILFLLISIILKFLYIDYNISPAKKTSVKVNMTIQVNSTNNLAKESVKKIMVEKSDFTIPVPQDLINTKKAKITKTVKENNNVKERSANSKDKDIYANSNILDESLLSNMTEIIDNKDDSFGISNDTKSDTGYSGDDFSKQDIKSMAISSILNEIERHKKYPKQAKRLSLEGVVKLLIVVDANGNIEDISVFEPSNFDIFNNAVHDIAKKIINLKVVKEGSLMEKFSVVVPISYFLQ